MARPLLIAAMLAMCLGGAAASATQQAVRLTITVTLADAAGVDTPVAGHPLLVSDYPPSRAPQRVVTASDGTASLNLRPGRYIVESGERVSFADQAYQWIEIVDVVAGAESALQLSNANARAEPLTSGMSARPVDAGSIAEEAEDDPVDVSPAALRRRWRNTVVGIWTPMRHASGFVVDTRGLIATSRRAVGEGRDVEVQITSSLKVAGRVLESEAESDVALIRVHPDTVELITPLPFDCAVPAMPLRDEDEVYTIGAPLRGTPNLVFGEARRVNSRLVVADFNLRRISPGGPVLAEDGRLVGIASVRDEEQEFVFSGDAPVVTTGQACAALAAARDAFADPPPAGARLPVDPDIVLTAEELDAAVAARSGDVEPYALETDRFEVALLTPPIVYSAMRRSDPPKMEFGPWTDYVWDAPGVLLIRVTPKPSEGLFSRLVRSAALTQGQVVPPNVRFRFGFERLVALCGDQAVVPIHPLRLETAFFEVTTAGEGRTAVQRSDERILREGLYAFMPDALGPACGSVRLMLHADDEPDKPETLVIDATILERIGQDFARPPR